MSSEQHEVKEEHKHGENCDHDHDHDHEHDHDDKKGKSEKKVRKALGKLGMTKVEGVNRVTLRQKDNYILVVKDPEVYTSPQTENTFIIFGELTFEDPDKKLAKEEMDKIKAEGEKLKPEVTTETPKVVEVVDENEPVSEEGLDPESIEAVLSECQVSRNRAVRELKAANGDVVNAILNINSQS